MTDPFPATPPAAARPARLALALLSLALAAPLAARAADGPAPDGDEAFYQRAADCAASMEIDQLALVARARAGEKALRPQIVQLTADGFAYVGTAFKRGLRNPRADRMLAAALGEQKGWDWPRHEKLSAQCTREARALYDNASSLERWLVDRKAAKRVDRYLSSPNAPPNPAASMPAAAAR